MNGDYDSGDKLPGSVARALDALRPVPEPDPEVWKQSRHSYITAATALAGARRSEAPLVPQPVSRKPERWQVFRGLAGAVRGFMQFRTWRAIPTRAVLISALALALFLGSSVGAVSAARDSLPGTPLYGLKIKLEQWALGRAQTPQAVSSEALAQSQIRVDEAARMVAAGDPVPIEVAARFQEQLTLAVQATGSLDEPLRLQARSRISETLQHQIRAMTEISSKVKDGSSETVDHGAVLAMIQAMVQTQAQLGPGQGEGQVDGTPGQEQEPTTAEPADECDGPDCGNHEGPAGPDQGPGPGDNDAPGGDHGRPGDPGNGHSGNEAPGQNGPGAPSTPTTPDSRQILPEQPLFAQRLTAKGPLGSESLSSASSAPQRSPAPGSSTVSSAGPSR